MQHAYANMPMQYAYAACLCSMQTPIKSMEMCGPHVVKCDAMILNINDCCRLVFISNALYTII